MKEYKSGTLFRRISKNKNLLFSPLDHKDGRIPLNDVWILIGVDKKWYEPRSIFFSLRTKKLFYWSWSQKHTFPKHFEEIKYE